jgi:hypothetical protein
MLLHPYISSALIPLLFIHSTRTFGMVHKLWGRTMAQAASRRPLTAEVWVQSRVIACGICCTQSGTVKLLTFSLVRIIPPMFYTQYPISDTP